MLKTIALVVLLIGAAIADQAPLLHADNPNAISGSYIVVLKDGLSVMQRDAHIADLKNAATGVEVGFVYTQALFGFSARLSPEMLKSELLHPYVKYIEVDQTVSLVDQAPQTARAPLDTVTQTGATWGIDRISQKALPLDGDYVYDVQAGSGVDVYVIDTGILTTHTDFDTRATFAYSAVTGEANTDLNGHGTHCAGTIGGRIYGVAKQVNLFAVKVLNAGGSGTLAGVVAGVDYVTVNKDKTRPSVGSMSLGGSASTAMDQAVANSIANGTSYAIAAGNSNANACNYSPARVPAAVTVGSTTITDARSSFSNYGPCVDIFAPGSDITSDWIGSNTAINTISGTSMATPHVAGVIAIHLSLSVTPLTPAQVSAWLNSTGTPGIVTNAGAGSNNVLLYSPSA